MAEFDHSGWQSDTVRTNGEGPTVEDVAVEFQQRAERENPDLLKKEPGDSKEELARKKEVKKELKQEEAEAAKKAKAEEKANADDAKASDENTKTPPSARKGGDGPEKDAEVAKEASGRSGSSNAPGVADSR